MAMVRQCRVCNEIHRPDAAACRQGHGSFSLMAVERADFIICPHCGNPTPASGDVCATCGKSLGAADTRDLVAAFWTEALTAAKLAERIERVNDYLVFVHDGLEVLIDLRPADRLEVLVRYYAADLRPLPRNCFGAPLDQSQFLAAANSLNTSLGCVKIFLGGPKCVWFQYSNPLFFDLAAQGPQGSIEPGRFEPILRAILPTLEFTIRQFFTTVGREYDRSNRALPPGQVTIPRPQIEYIPEALKLLGINGFSSNPGKPELHLFLGDYLFIVRYAKNDWKWSVSLPFLEEQRFVPKVHIGNVIHGTTGSRFHEICNEFNQRYAPVKSFCLVEAGQVYLQASGRIPFVSLQQVAEGLKHVFDLLYSCRPLLFEKAGLETSGFATRLVRQ
jgi:hypothetical protein